MYINDILSKKIDRFNGQKLVTGQQYKTYCGNKARYTRYKFCIQVSIQENLNSSLCIHDARKFDEYTHVLAGDTTNKMAFLGGEEGAALCIAL